MNEEDMKIFESRIEMMRALSGLREVMGSDSEEECSGCEKCCSISKERKSDMLKGLYEESYRLFTLSRHDADGTGGYIKRMIDVHTLINLITDGEQ